MVVCLGFLVSPGIFWVVWETRLRHLTDRLAGHMIAFCAVLDSLGMSTLSWNKVLVGEIED